ncbi:MAG: hypothetical protein IJY08_04185, partial [Clostridia bacterium]|nr:hypothetical protein [Clostridia bacterium]
GVIVTEDSNVTVNVNSSTLTANKNGVADQYILALRENAVTITMDKNTVLNTNSGYLKGFAEDQTITVPAAYVDELGLEGYAANIDVTAGVATVLGNAVVKIGNTYYGSLKSALEAAKTNDVITLLADITLNEMLTVNTAVTIDGTNGDSVYTITSTAKKAFEVNASATFHNVAIVNNAADGRCIDTRTGNITLKLENVTLTAENGASQPLNIGGSGSNITVVITDSTIIAGTGYAITTWNPVTMSIANSDISGWAALNIKGASNSIGSAGSAITVKDSTITGTNTYNGTSDGFSVITVEDKNVTIKIQGNSTITANKTGEANQFVIDLNAHQGVTVNMDATVTVESNDGYLAGYVAGQTIKLPEAVASAITAENYTYETADGVITVTGTVSSAPTETGFTGANMTIGKDLSMKYYVFVAEEHVGKEITVRFTVNGNEAVEEVQTPDASGEYAFVVKIYPQMLADNIKAEILVDGVVLESATKDNYSAKQYLLDLMALNPNNEKLKTLISNILVYGEETQKYRGEYNSENPILDEATKAIITPTSKTPTVNSALLTDSTSTVGTKFYQSGIYISNTNKLYFTFVSNDIDNVSVKINGKDVEYQKYTTIEGVGDVYIVFTDELYANQLDANHYAVSLYDGDTLVQLYNYCAQDYVYAMKDHATAGAITVALYNYVKAAVDYFEW